MLKDHLDRTRKKKGEKGKVKNNANIGPHPAQRLTKGSGALCRHSEILAPLKTMRVLQVASDFSGGRISPTVCVCMELIAGDPRMEF